MILFIRNLLKMSSISIPSSQIASNDALLGASQPPCAQPQPMEESTSTENKMDASSSPSGGQEVTESSHLGNGGHVAKVLFTSINPLNTTTGASTTTSTTPVKTTTTTTAGPFYFPVPSSANSGIPTAVPFDHSKSDPEAIMKRTLLFKLPREGGLYTSEYFVGMFKQKGIPPSAIEALGRLSRGCDWHVTLTPGNENLLEKLLLEQVWVKSRLAKVSCVARNIVKLRIHWLPYFIPRSIIQDQLKVWGHIEQYAEESNISLGLTHAKSLIRAAVMEVPKIASVPHTGNLVFNGIQYPFLITMPGRPPICLRCKEVGHIRKDCQAEYCRHCRLFAGHSSEVCSNRNSYAAQVRGSLQKDDEMYDDVFEEQFQRGVMGAGRNDKSYIEWKRHVDEVKERKKKEEEKEKNAEEEKKKKGESDKEKEEKGKKGESDKENQIEQEDVEVEVEEGEEVQEEEKAEDTTEENESPEENGEDGEDSQGVLMIDTEKEESEEEEEVEATVVVRSRGIVEGSVDSHKRDHSEDSVNDGVGFVAVGKKKKKGRKKKKDALSSQDEHSV